MASALTRRLAVDPVLYLEVEVPLRYLDELLVVVPLLFKLDRPLFVLYLPEFVLVPVPRFDLPLNELEAREFLP